MFLKCSQKTKDKSTMTCNSVFSFDIGDIPEISGGGVNNNELNSHSSWGTGRSYRRVCVPRISPFRKDSGSSLAFFIHWVLSAWDTELALVTWERMKLRRGERLRWKQTLSGLFLVDFTCHFLRLLLDSSSFSLTPSSASSSSFQIKRHPERRGYALRADALPPNIGNKCRTWESSLTQVMSEPVFMKNTNFMIFEK